jgi:hypothetical protein
LLYDLTLQSAFYYHMILCHWLADLDAGEPHVECEGARARLFPEGGAATWAAAL